MISRVVNSLPCLLLSLDFLECGLRIGIFVTLVLLYLNTRKRILNVSGTRPRSGVSTQVSLKPATIPFSFQQALAKNTTRRKYQANPQN